MAGLLMVEKTGIESITKQKIPPISLDKQFTMVHYTEGKKNIEEWAQICSSSET
jgi:hypothetical protein